MKIPQLPKLALNELKSFHSNMSWGISDPVRFNQLMEEAKTLVAPGFYLGDNLFTWSRNISALDDPQFMESWSNNILNDADEAIMWRRYLLACSGLHAIHLAGDFVECGVYAGSGIKTVVDYLGGTEFPKQVWGYDTFDYNPVAGHEFPGQAEGFFETVCDRFSDYPQVRLIKGLIPDSFAQGIPDQVSFLHIDLNNVEGEIATLEQLFERVVPGGMVVLDDYEWSGIYRPQKQAEDQWFQQRGYRVFPLPTGQGFVIKR